MKKGFVVSAVLYPLLVIALALIMGIIAMSDNRRKILDNMKLEVSEESDIDPEMSNTALYYEIASLKETIAEMQARLSEERLEELKSEAKLEAFPIGSIFISTTNKNPGSYIGGTWQAYGSGRTLVGKSTSLTAGATGGNDSITLSESQMPSHSHTVTARGSVSSTFTGSSSTTSTTGDHYHSINAIGYAESGSSSNPRFGVSWSYTTSTMATDNTGNHYHTVTPNGIVSSTFIGNQATTSTSGLSSSIDIRNPYVVVYFWKRTA